MESFRAAKWNLMYLHVTSILGLGSSGWMLILFHMQFRDISSSAVELETLNFMRMGTKTKKATQTQDTQE